MVRRKVLRRPTQPARSSVNSGLGISLHQDAGFPEPKLCSPARYSIAGLIRRRGDHHGATLCAVAIRYQYHCVPKASNGETIIGSERYATKANALGGIASVHNNSPIDARYEKRTATHGQFYFALKATNGEVIGTSETYTSSAGRDAGSHRSSRMVPTPRSLTTPEITSKKAG